MTSDLGYHLPLSEIRSGTPTRTQRAPGLAASGPVVAGGAGVRQAPPGPRGGDHPQQPNAGPAEAAEFWAEHAVEPAVGAEQHVLTAQPGAQHDGQQFRVGQSLAAHGQQFFAGAGGFRDFL